MAARKHNPGPTPQRGEVAGTVVSVRLTAAELAHLDSLWPHPGRRVVRGEVVRALIAAAEPRQTRVLVRALTAEQVDQAERLTRDLARGHDDDGRPVVAVPLSAVGG